ncbi:MAG: transcription elongation factor GreA [Lachnospiraceae bacterium]|nr:transcription elongation factor GreA [Lachnospiraceae bacterium]
MAKNKLTRAGLEKYERELDELKLVRRKEVAQKIKEAKEQGDLSENAEYDAARDEQRDVEARIQELEAMLKDVEVIDVESKNGKLTRVSFGCSVKIQELSSGEEMTFAIKSANEAKSLSGVISDESPLGRAILNAKKGDKVSVEAPMGTLEYKVLDMWMEKD